MFKTSFAGGIFCSIDKTITIGVILTKLLWIFKELNISKSDSKMKYSYFQHAQTLEYSVHHLCWHQQNEIRFDHLVPKDQDIHFGRYRRRSLLVLVIDWIKESVWVLSVYRWIATGIYTPACEQTKTYLLLTYRIFNCADEYLWVISLDQANNYKEYFCSLLF